MRNGEQCLQKPNPKQENTPVLKNINTGEKIEISIRALIDIERGQTSVDNIRKCREVGTASWLVKKRAEKKKKLKAIDDTKL